MSGFADNMLDLMKGLIILIVGIYVLYALIGILEIGKMIGQFVQSIGFGVIVVAGIIIFLLLLRGEI